MTSLKGLWSVLLTLTVLSLILEWPLSYVLPAAVGVSWFGFSAVYGFVCCFALIAVALFAGVFVKREEKYYDR